MDAAAACSLTAVQGSYDDKREMEEKLGKLSLTNEMKKNIGSSSNCGKLAGTAEQRRAAREQREAALCREEAAIRLEEAAIRLKVAAIREKIAARRQNKAII